MASNKADASPGDLKQGDTGRGDTNWQVLASRLGHDFKAPDLLQKALTHPSTLSRHAPSRSTIAGDSYERLEFLGDRVLGLVIADLLLRQFPDEDEGALARRHTALVRREALAQVAEVLDLGRYLIIAKGEEETGARDNPALLADACEAVLAALYLDGGLPAARALVEAHWVPMMEAALEPPQDAKTALQEWAQGRGLPLPDYQETGREGPPHEPVFTVTVTVTGYPPAQGRGRSKRAAEQAAAELQLAQLQTREA